MLTRRGQDYDPLVNYSFENYPPTVEQKEFFRCALLEGAAVEKPSRFIRGPLFDTYLTVLQEINNLISDLNPIFNAECIIPTSYQSQATRALLQDISRDERRALGEIAERKAATLLAIPRSSIGETLSSQQLPMGTLDVPHYAKQKEDWNNFDGVRGCTNACFRMVFGTIAGWMPSQAAVSECLEEQYSTSVVDDSVYASIYKTEVFGEICPKHITSIELIGADFETIGKIATRMKQKHSDSELYCMVNLASKTAGNKVWHSCILLGVENGTVTYHDPLNNGGGAYCKASVESFLARWTIAYNRALITIAV